jgi:pimeloyl-ACP methyl ester carboxylesterase
LANWTETTVNVGGTDVALIRGGSGKPLFMLHDELGFPGWVNWNEALAEEHEFLIPLQPGCGKTPRVDWIRTYRDLGGFYARMIREMGLDPLDAIAFSAGSYAAAEMAAADPGMFKHLVLVAPMGVKPEEGEITDIFPLTIRTHMRATVADINAPEFGDIYGGEMTPDQFEAFEDARAEAARIGWEPYMHNPSLPHLLEGVQGLPTLIVWGRDDRIVPLSAGEAYNRAIAGSELLVLDDCGHRPEIEHTPQFVNRVRGFLAQE